MGFYNLQGVLPSPYRLPANIFVSATTPPSGVVNEVAMTLTNTQSSAVSAGTPVSLDVNWTQFNRYNSAHRNWVAPNLENVMFYDSEGSGTGQPLNAWIEGCSNSTISASSPYSTTGCTWGYEHSIVWLKLNATGIPATATIVVYLGFLSNTTNNFNTNANGCTDCWGEAPYIDGTQTGINIIHDWAFDDNTGTTASDNVSSGAAAGTLSGGTAPAWTTTGCKFGHCLTFSTAYSNYVNFGTSAFGSPPYTLQMWFSFSSNPATSTCYGLALFVGGNLDICNTASVVKAQLSGLGPATTTDGTSLSISTLYFVSAYVSGTGASQTQGISLNGDAYTTSTGTVTITNRLQVGRDATPNYCNCIIDNVEMESSVQTLSQTQATHNAAYPQHQYGIYDTGTQVFSAYTNFGGTTTPAGFAQSVTGSTNLGTSYLNENNGLNFTISTSVIGSGFPAGIVAFFTFTIQNSQTSPIPGGASVPLYINWGQYAPYVASNYQNVEFFDHQVHALNAWLETNVQTNGGTTGTVWLQLNSTGIPASTTFTYYIAFRSTGTNFFDSAGPWGEAPTLSGTYGQYDDGSHVFSFYDNFVGSSLSGTNWNTPVNVGATSRDQESYTTETVNNGLIFAFEINASSTTLSASEFGYNVYSKTAYSGVTEMSDSFVANIENYYAPLAQPFGWIGMSTSIPSATATSSFGYTNAYIAGISGDGTFCDSCQALRFGVASSSAFTNLYTNNLGMYVDNVGMNWTATGSEYASYTTHLWTSSPSYYSTSQTDSSLSFASGYVDLAGIAQPPNSGPLNTGTFLTVHWVRVRTALPGGVNPTVTMPSPGGSGPTFSVDTTSQQTHGVVDAYSTFVAPAFNPAYGIISNSKVWEDTSAATGANTGYVFQYGSSTQIAEYSGGSQTASTSGGSNTVSNMVGGSWPATGTEYLHDGYVTALFSTFSGVSAANSYIGLGMVGATYSNSTITTYFLRDRIAPPNDVMPSNEILISETVVVSVALAYGQSGSGGVNGQQLSDGPFSNSVAPSYAGNDGTSLSDGPFSSSIGNAYGTGGTNQGQQLTEGITESVGAYSATVQPLQLVYTPSGKGNSPYPSFSLAGQPSTCPATVSPSSEPGDSTTNNVNTNTNCQITVTAPAGYLLNSTHASTASFTVCGNVNPCSTETIDYYNVTTAQPVKLTEQGGPLSNCPNYAPTGLASCISFTITNSQTTATTTNFDDLVAVNWSNQTGVASTVQNVVWFDSSGNILNAWCESGCSSSAAKSNVWVKIQSAISGSSSASIYEGLYPTTTNNFNTIGPWGEAPNSTGTYGQYDDGAKVFAFYNNFNGTSICSCFDTTQISAGGSSGSLTVNNGLTITGTSASGGYGGGYYIGLKTSFSGALATDLNAFGYNGPSSISSETAEVFSMVGSSPTTATTGWGDWNGISAATAYNEQELGYYSSGTLSFAVAGSAYGTLNGYYAISWIPSPESQYARLNGATALTATSSVISVATVYPLFYMANGLPSPYTVVHEEFNWYDVRVPPPGNVMPTSSQGSGGPSFPSFTISSTSCTPSPTTISGSATAYAIIVVPNCVFTITAPAGYHFVGTGSGTQSVTACATYGTCSEQDFTYASGNPTSTFTLLNSQGLSIQYLSNSVQTSSSNTVLNVDASSVFTVLGPNFNGQFTMSQNGSAIYEVPSQFGNGIQVFSTISLSLFNYTNAQPKPFLNMTGTSATILVLNPTTSTGMSDLSTTVAGGSYTPTFSQNNKLRHPFHEPARNTCDSLVMNRQRVLQTGLNIFLRFLQA